MVLVFMLINQDTRISLIVGIVFLIVVALSFLYLGLENENRLKQLLLIKR